MEKFVKGSDYKVMVAHAIAHGIEHSGVNKPQLADTLNAKIDEIGEDKYLEVITAAEAATQVAEQAGQAAPVGTTTPAPVAKAAKWWEEQGFAYQDGDVVEIVNHRIKGLNGRFAVVNKPSAKKEALKAFLLEPKTGERQATNITLDYPNAQPTGKTVDDVIAEIQAVAAAKLKEQEDKKTAREAEKEANKTKREQEKAARIAAAQQTPATATATATA